jgi:hypothetical protein
VPQDSLWTSQSLGLSRLGLNAMIWPTIPVCSPRANRISMFQAKKNHQK